jgi:hypothetical protein
MHREIRRGKFDAGDSTRRPTKKFRQSRDEIIAAGANLSARLKKISPFCKSCDGFEKLRRRRVFTLGQRRRWLVIGGWKESAFVIEAGYHEVPLGILTGTE